MKPSDPRLTAYVLGELDAVERKSFEEQLSQDDAAQRELAGIQATVDALTKEPESATERTLRLEQREVIEASLMIGKTLADEYKIESLLGVGGGAAVYCARVLERGKQPDHVAIKVIKKSAFQGDGFRRFKEELRLGKKVHERAPPEKTVAHTNVVRIHSDDAREVDGVVKLYLVMEYVEGQTLEQLCHTKQLTEKKVLAIAEQVASGLVELHGAGALHRDLSMRNVMVTHEDRAVIMDLGIAHYLSPKAQAPDNVLGTPLYVAPETILGEKPDERADLYSLGVIMYELLAGHNPFEAESLRKVQKKVLEVEAPRLCGVTRFTADVVATLMDKNRDRRLFVSARQLYDSLRSPCWAGLVRPGIGEAIRAVAAHFGATPEDVKGSDSEFALARRVAMSLLVRSYPVDEIGRAFSRSAHAVRTAAKRVDRECRINPDLGEELDDLQALI